MSFIRPLLLIFMSGCLWGGIASAQDSTGTAPAAAGGTSPDSGASSSFGTPSNPSNATPGRVPGSLNPFGDEAPTPKPNGTTPPSSASEASTLPGANADGTTPGGAASSFGLGTQGAAATRTAPASFTVPGLYGRGPQQFTAGEGRLARPRFEFSGNVSLGYDDNVFQTPTHPLVQPDQKVLVLKSLGTPASIVELTVPSGDPLVPDTVRVVEVPAQGPKYNTEVIPATPPPTRIGSFVTRASGTWDTQFASRRTLFTFDLNLGADYYWNRPGKKLEYNDHLSMIYLRRLTGRTQFTISADASYQAQPDFSQINTPTTNNGGSYLTANLKADLSYRMTPRISTVTSLSYNGLYSEEQTQQSSDYAETTAGLELRYLLSPKLTMLGEMRFSWDKHQDSPELDSTSYILLVGGELTLSRRFTASLRLGETYRTYTETEAKDSSPYGEATLGYRIGRATTVQFNARYGYEETQGANSQVVTLRSGLSVTQLFSARLQGSLAVNFVRSDTSASNATSSSTNTSSGTASTSSSANTSTSTASASSSTASQTIVPSSTLTQTASVSNDQITDTIDATLAFHYMLSRHWGFNLSYAYTTQLGPEKTSDYYRQRVFLGAEYQF
jgi:hypothetical protein